MVSEDVQRWIIEAQKRGLELSQIKKELKEHNYGENLADKVLKTQKSFKKRMMAASILVIIILSILGYVLFEKFYVTEDKLLKDAEGLYLKQSYNKAKTMYEKVLEKNPENYRAILRLGSIYYQEKNYTTALSFFKSIPPKTKLKNANIPRRIGLTYYKMGDYENAKTYLEKELSRNKGDYLANYILGITYLKLEDYEKSKTYFEKALEIKPNSTISYQGLGLAYYKLKDYQNAKEYLITSVEYYPDDYSVNFALGSTYYYLGEYENSQKYLTQALSLNPDSEETKEALGLVSEKTKSA